MITQNFSLELNKLIVNHYTGNNTLLLGSSCDYIEFNKDVFFTGTALNFRRNLDGVVLGRSANNGCVQIIGKDSHCFLDFLDSSIISTDTDYTARLGIQPTGIEMLYKSSLKLIVDSSNFHIRNSKLLVDTFDVVDDIQTDNAEIGLLKNKTGANSTEIDILKNKTKTPIPFYLNTTEYTSNSVINLSIFIRYNIQAERRCNTRRFHF